MREIKFRAWYQNKMHYNITKAHYEHNAMSGHGGDLWDFNEWLKWSKVMQYTGLKDKNGKEIYEGDVIKYHRVFESKREVIELTSCIKFQNGAFGFDMKGFNDMFMSLGDDSDIEVIGNIFENKDLLEKEQ